LSVLIIVDAESDWEIIFCRITFSNRTNKTFDLQSIPLLRGFADVFFFFCVSCVCRPSTLIRFPLLDDEEEVDEDEDEEDTNTGGNGHFWLLRAGLQFNRRGVAPSNEIGGITIASLLLLFMLTLPVALVSSTVLFLLVVVGVLLTVTVLLFELVMFSKLSDLLWTDLVSVFVVAADVLVLEEEQQEFGIGDDGK